MINVLKTKQLKLAIANMPQKILEIIDNETELGICVTNEKGIYVAVNDKYCEIYDYTKEEFLGQSFLMVVPKDNQVKLTVLHDKFIEQEYEILRNWEVQRKNGAVIKIQADAGFFNQIFDKTPHKVTFVDPNI